MFNFGYAPSFQNKKVLKIIKRWKTVKSDMQFSMPPESNTKVSRFKSPLTVPYTSPSLHLPVNLCCALNRDHPSMTHFSLPGSSTKCLPNSSHSIHRQRNPGSPSGAVQIASSVITPSSRHWLSSFWGPQIFPLWQTFPCSTGRAF